MAFDSKPRPDSVSAFASLKSETLLRRLEPRIMFDAAAVETAIDALHTDPAHEPIAIDAPDGAMDVPAAALHGSDLVGLADHLDGPVAVQTMPGAKTIVFIDANVPDLAVLEAAIADTSEIVVLDPAKDGLDQVAAYLADRHDLDAIHIISHGEPGKLHLGSSTYDAATLKAFDAELGQIGASLQQGGDILIYGCDVAKGASGDAFVHKFAQLTHHDVAASTDLTGSAAQGGNWTLETHTGAIEAATIAATGWHGELAALNISVSSQPVQTGGSNTGAVGLWTNAGTIGGVAIDIRATVISADPGATVTFASAIGFYDAAHTLKADDMWVQLTSGSATVKWEIFQSGTNQTLAAVGDPNFRISDIDGSGGAIPAAPTVEVEAVAPDLHGLTSYTLDSPTNLNATIINGDILVRGTQNQNAEPTSLVAFNWTKVTSWDVTYTAVAGWGGRNFFHDGNGDFKFVSPQTVNLLAIDADANDSTAAGASYKATFVELAAPVPVVDSDVHIAQHSVIGANIDRAEVILTNAQTADELLVGGSSNSSGTIDGLSYTISSAGGQITVALSGNASPATYEAALHAITFNNTSHDPSSVDRNLTVSVTNDTYGTTSNLAASTILVSPVNDAPVEVVPGAQGAFTNVALAIPGLAVSDIDADGGLETVTLSVAHGTLTLPVKAGLTFTTGDGTADTTMVFKGTLANINAALATLSYTSAASYAGIDTLTFTTNDNGNTGSGGALSSGAQTVAITVVDPPHATDDAFYTTQDTPITVSVLANDTDLQSYPLTVTQVDGHAILAGDPAGVAVTGGIVTLDATGKLTYTPDAGYLGTPTFTYTVDDGHGLTDTATVNGSVTPLNHAPVNVLPGNQQAVGGTVVFSAANGNAIQVTDDASATQIIQTTVSVDKGTLTLHQLTGLTFLAGDGTADATITMQGTKAAINAALDGMTMTGPGGTPTPATLTIKTDDLGHPNGEDIPNGSFETTLLSVPAGGQLTMLESNVPGWKTTATDHMIEIWGSGFQGVPAYEGIHFAELNANQVAADYNTSTIPKGQPLTFSFAHRGRAGVDVMNVTVIDAGADGVFGTADDTTLMNQNYSDGTSAWGAYSKDLGAASGNPVRLIFNSVSSAGGATLGNFLDAVHLGTAHLTDTDTVMINFNRPPAANPDSYNSLEDHIVTGNVLSNDTDPDGNTLTVIDADGNAANGISPVTGPAHGTLLLNADGTFKYYPDNNYNGTDSFTYRVSDGNGGTAEATATITIAPVNDAPHVTVNTDTPTTLAYAAAWWHSSFNTAPNTMSPFTASAANELAGPGLSLVVSGTHADVSGVDATSYAGAIANGEYIQYSFTTTGTVDPNVFIAAAALNNPGATGTVAIQLATHADFSDARTMTDGVALNTSAYADFNDRTYLEPNTTYYVRAYLYNVPGTQRWDDFGVLLKKAVPDYVTTFTEGDAPVAATNTASADANDKGEADLTHLTITANGIVDGAAEHLTIGGKSFTLSSSSAQSVAFGTTTFQLTYNATTHIFDVQNAAGSTVPMLQADVDTLLRSLSYENTSQNPSTNDRTFAVQVTDSGGLTSNIATATIHVVPVNDPPEVVVSLGDKTGLDGSAVLIVTKGAFADPDGDTLAFSATGLPLGLSIDAATGKITGTLHADASVGTALHDGDYDVAVTATDPSGASVIEHFVFRAKNIAPVATDDLASTNEDTSVTFDVRTNDHDGAPDADALTVSAIDGHGVIAGGASVPVAHGDVTLGLDGKLTFHPAPDFNGSVVFAYTVSDGQGGLATANVQITVLPINDAPTVSAPGTYTTPEDVTKALTGLSFADSDAGNANVTVTLSVAHGTLDIDTSVAGGITAAQVTGDVSGTITITAPIAKINATLANATGLIYASSANFNGADALTVTVNDLGNTGAGGPLNATSLTAIAVTPVNDQPLIDLNSAASTTDTLRDNTVIFTEGDAAIHVATVSADVNDIAEADITSLTIVEGSISNGAAEIVSIGGKSFPSHADSTQTATVGGSSVSIAYVASTHAFTITNATGASNPIPQADLDALIRGITYKNTSENPTAGDRTLTFTATDAGGLTSLAAVATITVVPVNDPPAPAADANAVAEDTTLTANVAQGVLSNDTDVDGGALSVTQFTVAGVTGTFAAGTTANIPGAGSLTINADGSYIFVPVSNYNGAVPVATYTVSDGNTGGTSISTLSLTVTPVNDPPHVELQTVSYGVNLITNGDFESGFAGWAGPFVTPASIYQQVSTASGVVTDHTAGSPTGHAALIDTGYPDGYTGDLLQQVIPLQAGKTYTFDLWATPIYPANAPVIQLLVDGVPFATQTLDVSTGTAWQHIVATYTPATDGSHTFSIRDINPAGGGNDFAIDDIRVAEIITGPEPYVTTYTENGAGVPIADITGSVTDPDNTTITSAVITLTDAQTADFLSSGNMPAGISASAYDPVTHTITLSGTATLASYQIALQAITFANSSDALSNVDRHVSVTVNDGALDSNTSFATVHVIPVNDPPVAQHDSLVTDQNTAITGNVLAANGLGADSDVEGDTLAVTEINGQTYTPGQQFTLPSGALLTVAGDGTFAYDPNHAFDALGHTQNTFDTFSYQISDGHGGFSTATATVEVKGLDDPMSITGLTDGTVAGTDASVTESSLTGGSTAGDGHQTVAGVFTVSAGDLPNFLYANGQTVFGGPIAGSYGTLTIMGVSPTAGVTNGTTYDIAYSYTLTGPVDHTAGAVADTFSLIFGDNDGDTVTANLNIAIADDKPMALDDAADATEDQTTAVTGSVITNDPFGADGASASPVIGVIAGDNCAEDTGANVGQPVQGLYGTLTLNADGTYSYQLDNNNPSVQALSAGATMNEVFTYQIADNEAGSGTTATTTVSVSFASFPAASNMSASACNDPNMPEAKLVITITGVNDAPVANTDAGTAPEDGPAATGNVLTTPGLGIDTDVDGDTLQVTGGVQGSHVLVLETPFTTAGGGVLTLHGDGSYTFDPGTAYNALPVGSTATETIAYTISDGHGGTATANLVITITGANDAPELLVSLGDKSGFDGGAVFITTAGAFSDPDHDTLYFSAAGLPASLTIDPLTGKITGTLDASDSIGGPNNDGIYIVTVTADDHHGGTVSDSFRFTATNLKPVAVNDVATVSEDGPAASGNVLSDITTGDHDTAPDSDPLMVTGGTQGATVIALDTPTTLSGGGELTLHADGSYSFTPGTAYNGLAQGATATETVTYDITDGNGGVAQATLVITVQGQNDAPVAINPANPGTPANPIPAADPLHVIPDVASTDGATPAAVDVGAILRDPDGETLVFTATGLPIGLAIDPNTGIITGTLPADASQHGPYTVHVIATDPHGVAATTDVIYRAINLPPVAENDTATTAENTVATGKALSNDHDAAPDADMLHIAEINGNPASVGRPVIGSTGGTFVVKPDGTWTFDPGHAFDNLAVGQSRDTQVTYLVADGEGGTDTATITVTVTGVNDPPVALGPIAPVSGADSVSVTPIDTSVAFSNPNHLPLTYTATNLPAGLVIDPATGVIAGTPAHDASVQGPYVVTVTATAPTGATSSTLLQINVANPGPTSVADNAATPAGTPVVIVPLANDSDPDHDVLSITSIASPAHGTATLTSDGTIIYVPNAGFTGTETISYTISDAQGGTSTASITIVVGAPPAGAPVLVGAPASQNGTDGSPITPIDIGALVTDPNGQILAFSATGLPAGLTIDPATGIISGTPASDASLFGPYSVVVTAVDPDGNQVSTTLLLAIADPAPVAANDATSTPANTPVVISLLANDTDPDHDSLNVSYVSAPAHGTVIINPDGTVTYTPNAGYIGPDAFTYTASDGQGGTSAATVAVAVGSSNPNAPTVDAATPHTATGTDGAPIAPINVGSHITDPNHDPLAFTASGLPAGLVINPATGVITGTLPNDASAQGPYTVTVTAVDPAGNQVMTTLVIAATNPAPMASNDTATTIAGQPVVIGVLANDTDPDHDALTVTSAMPPSHGTVTINPNGTITYKPLAVYTGTDTFQYKITDANGATASATVTLNVGVPGPLAATPAIAPVTGSDGQPIAPVPVAAAFGDPDQVGTLTLSVDPTELPPGISFVGGAFAGTPANNASQGHTPGQPAGTYVVAVTATDPAGATTTTFVTFNFVNLPPVAANDTPSVSEDGPELSGNVLANDHDSAPDSDPLSVTAASQGGTTITFGTPFTVAGGGVLILNANGLYTFNPGSAYTSLPIGTSAIETIDYTVSDGNGGTTGAKLIITIDGANDVPVIVDPVTGQPIAIGDPVIAPQHGTDAQPIQPIATAGFFKDPDQGDTLTYSVADLPKGLTFNPVTGLISGTLDKHASVGGPFTVEVTATDNHGGHSTATFVWAIDNPVPVAVGEVARTTSGVALHSTVAGNDVDPDNDGISYQVTTGPSHGTLTLRPDGTYTFEANSQFSGNDSFTYAVVDADGGVSYAVCRITVDPALNIVQQTSGGQNSHVTGPSQHLLDVHTGTSSDGVDGYVRSVANEEVSDTLPAGASEHIRLVVEGRIDQLNQQYGAAQRDVPMHWNLGLGREGGHGGGTVYEPLGDTPFWHGLNPLDFSGLAARPADVGGLEPAAVLAHDADQAILFGDRLAQIRSRFDREALRLMADLEDAA